ncbi:MAG: ribose 5-phosphate isomerase B [Bdellovibrio sp.]|nr:ribose 5-phosphate isomerase B [Bdellovibrio sp.]
MQAKKVLIASDHAGLRLKRELQTLLPEWTWIDLGPLNESSVDYPDFAEKLTRGILKGDAPLGILICGSGIGMSIAANKVPGIRAAVLENPVAARLAREHNNSNVLCLGSRFLAPEYASEIAQIWLTTPFSQNPRHAQRITKIHALERNPTSEES